MKRIAFLSTLLLLALAGPARAQLLGVPLWNDPNAGTGLTLSGDVGFPDSDGFGTVYAARGNFGLGPVQLGATLGMHEPDGHDRISSLGGTLAFRILGGAVLPVAVNAQGGFSTEDTDAGRFSRATAALGVGASAPVPGMSLQGWVSPGVRFLRHPSLDPLVDHETDTNFGVAAGASLGLGIMGVHLGVDHERMAGDTSETTFGVGVHIGLRAPVGM